VTDPQVIDAEVISEEKIPERPRASSSSTEKVVARPVSERAAETCNKVADVIESVGGKEFASNMRTGVAMGKAIVDNINAVKPVLESVRDLGRSLKESGIVKMVPRRRAFSPRSKVK
jgi:hypothetical protein